MKCQVNTENGDEDKNDSEEDVLLVIPDIETDIELRENYEAAQSNDPMIDENDDQDDNANDDNEVSMMIPHIEFDFEWLIIILCLYLYYWVIHDYIFLTKLFNDEILYRRNFLPTKFFVRRNRSLQATKILSPKLIAPKLMGDEINRS